MAALPPAHPLMQRLITEFGAEWVTLAGLSAWQQAAPGHAVLLVAGDAVRFPEGLDVAVVLPELAHSLGVSWRSTEPAGVEAELWAAIPQVAAPRAVEPEPVNTMMPAIIMPHTLTGIPVPHSESVIVPQS